MNTYLWAQLRSRRRRSIVVIAGVALGAALFVAISMLGAGFQKASKAPLESVGADMVLTKPVAGTGQQASVRGVRTPEGLADFSGADVTTVDTTDGVAAVSGALQLWEFGARETITIAGVDPAADQVGPGKLLRADMKEGRSFRPGERAVAVADLHYARFYDLKVGQTATVGGRPFQIVGIIEVANASQAASANMLIPLPDAQAMAGLAADRVNQIHVQLTDASRTDGVVADLNGKLGQVSAITEDSLVQVFGAIGQISAKFSTIAAIVGILGGILLSWVAMQGMVGERAREIGLLKAVGWRRRDVVRVIRAEAFVLSLIGAVLGIALGAVVASTFTDIPLPETEALPMQAGEHGGMDMGTASSQAPTLPVEFDLTTLAAALLAAVFAGTLAGWLTAHRAAKIKAARNLTAL